MSSSATVIVDSAPVASRSTELRRTHVLCIYLLLTYLAVLVNSSSYLREVQYEDALTRFFVAAVYLSYGWIYVLPVFIPVFLLNFLAGRRPCESLFRRRPTLHGALVFGAAVFLAGVLQVLLFADAFIFKLYGFHLNGFVWNLVFTRGGIESLGGSDQTDFSFALIVAALFVSQGLLLLLVLGWPRLQLALARCYSRRRLAIAVGLLAATAAFERITYAVCNLDGYKPVLVASGAFPLYLPTTITKLAKSLGVKVARDPSLKLDVDSFRIRYPLRPIERRPVDRPLNIVCLIAESLRADMVAPDIMPATWKFARKANWFRQHYSGGNGTRMGMFSMFYGLYGSFWFPFLEAHRGPVMFDVLADAGYQMKLFTSARFTYPEFDRTIFVRLKPEQLHEGAEQPPWRRDRENVRQLLDFVETRDPARPFMTFMFFESPHARYHFPPECAIRKPYAKDVNYATMDLARDIGLIKNRYINSCYHLDTQIQRILDYLEQHRLLDSTIVLITGDHGEEFMEKGRWGHNSAVTEEQTRAPLVLWVPGRPHREVTRMTSHLDVPATILPLLGVTNPPGDYSLGLDLLGDKAHEFVVISDWNTMAYVDAHYKAVFPLKAYGISRQKVSMKDDGPLKETAAFEQSKKGRMIQIMKDMRAFSR